MNVVWERIGHRGAPREFPGNTLRGFARAASLGCTMVECDARQAADGVIVLAHDAHVTDTTGATYAIAETTSATLRGLDLGAGEGVPTLAELANWAKGRCAVMADMKWAGNGVEEGVVAALHVLHGGAKVVAGAGPASRARFRALDPTLPLSLTLSDRIALAEGDALDTLLADLDTEAVTWHHALVTKERVAMLHQRDKKVYVWTVDDLPTMRRVLDCGADGLISNRPDLLQTL